MADKTGAARLRQAIKNQRDAGEGEFRLTYHDAEEIADEIEEEFESLSWAVGVPVPKDADGAVVPLAAEEPCTNNELYTNKGEKVLVDSICFNGFFWYVKDLRREPCRLDRLHRGERDSWERLEEDANLGCRDYCEKYRLEECDYNIRMHMLARAKALAERDAKGFAPRPSPHEEKEADRG